jgi:hypothetical protein
MPTVAWGREVGARAPRLAPPQYWLIGERPSGGLDRSQG